MKKVIWKEGSNKAKVAGHGEVGEKGCPYVMENNGKRIKCGNFKLTPTGKLYQGHRVYKCGKCNNFSASPTQWFGCSNEQIVREKNGLVGADEVIGIDCLYCPIPKREGFDIKLLVKEGKACPYFTGQIKFSNAGEIQQ